MGSRENGLKRVVTSPGVSTGEGAGSGRELGLWGREFLVTPGPVLRMLLPRLTK